MKEVVEGLPFNVEGKYYIGKWDGTGFTGVVEVSMDDRNGM